MGGPTGPMRVLTVASEAPGVTSGLGASVGKVVEGLIDRGHKVDVVSAGDAVSLRVGEFRLSGLAAVFPEIDTLCRAFDVIHVHGPCPTLSDALLLRLTRARRQAPTVVYTHHFDIWLEGLVKASRLYNRGHQALARRAAHVVATTPSYASELSRSMGRKVEVIPWGVDSERFGGTRHVGPYDGARPLRVLFVGQMRHYKGVAHLIDAVDGAPELDLTIVGGGPREAEFRRRASHVPHVRVLGRVDDEELVHHYLGCDVIVLPSVSPLEAFGLVLLEGMAAGCVPVASDLPGVRDVAGPTGCLVRPDDVATLRGALLDLARDPARVQLLAARSRAAAARCTWQACVGAYERLMLDALAAGRTSGSSSDLVSATT